MTFRNISICAEVIALVFAVIWLFPAVYWTIMLPVSTAVDEYIECKFEVVNVTRRGASPHGRGNIALRVVRGKIDDGQKLECVGIPMFVPVSIGSDFNVFFCYKRSPRFDIMGLSLRVIHKDHFKRRWIYFVLNLTLYFAPLLWYLFLTLKGKTIIWWLCHYDYKDVRGRSRYGYPI